MFFGYFFIIFVQPNSNSQNAFYKVLMANGATSALRLQQRMPPIQFTREFFAAFLVEDSCHYLFFSIIFLYVSPFVLILLPVVLFAILHAASYSLTLLDVSKSKLQFAIELPDDCGRTFKTVNVFMILFWCILCVCVCVDSWTKLVVGSSFNDLHCRITNIKHSAVGCFL